MNKKRKYIFTKKEKKKLSLDFQNLELEIQDLHENEKENDDRNEDDRENEVDIECTECSSVPLVVPKAPTPTPEVINQKVKKLTIKDYFTSKPRSNNV